MFLLSYSHVISIARFLPIGLDFFHTHHQSRETALALVRTYNVEHQTSIQHLQCSEEMPKVMKRQLVRDWLKCAFVEEFRNGNPKIRTF